MNKILNGKKMTSKEEAHDYIQDQLGLSSYYGKNLDALWDELTSLEGPLDIKIRHSKKIKNSLGAYGKRLIETFEDAARDNKNIRVKVKKWHFL